MKVKDLIAKLTAMNHPEAEVVVMTMHQHGDDVTDWQVQEVHDGWWRKQAGDMVSLEVDLDQRPEWTHNDTGAVFTEDDLRALATMLEQSTADEDERALYEKVMRELNYRIEAAAEIEKRKLNK